MLDKKMKNAKIFFFFFFDVGELLAGLTEIFTIQASKSNSSGK